MASVKMKVNLNETDKIKVFVNRLSAQPFEADLSSGRYIVDGKSLLGIFSLDLANPVELTIHSTPEECDGFIDWLAQEGILCS